MHAIQNAKEKRPIVLTTNLDYFRCLYIAILSIVLENGQISTWLEDRQPTESPEITTEELYGYVELELAASKAKLNNLKCYWSTKTFYGKDDFRRVMQRECFLKIKSYLQPDPGYPHGEAVLDPMWMPREKI